MPVWWIKSNINMIGVVLLPKLNFGSHLKMVLSFTMHICLFVFAFGIFISPILIYNIRSLNSSTVLSIALSGNLYFYSLSWYPLFLNWWGGIVCISLFHEWFFFFFLFCGVFFFFFFFFFSGLFQVMGYCLVLSENIKVNPKIHVSCGFWGIIPMDDLENYWN